MAHVPDLGRRFRDVLRGPEGLTDHARVLVAVSGGLDSCVLLHLLRFTPALPRIELVVAHFDHRMRRGSAADAAWVGGLCRAWDVGVVRGRADEPPTSEEGARNGRYTFLEATRRRVDAGVVLTAHHADDQAETVLFRMLRGTGLSGLRGIPSRREPALWRPLLPFWRSEIAEYAEEVGLAWRDDPTNDDLAYARNALRRRILEDSERLVAPGARRALVRLASLAEEEEAGWASLLPGLLGPLRVDHARDSVSFDRQGLARLHPAVRARVLRALAEELDHRLNASGTRLAVEFTSSGSSGSCIQLGGALEMVREFDRLVLAVTTAGLPSRPLSISDVGPGSGEVVLRGRRIPVEWGGPTSDLVDRAELFATEGLVFPLVVRAREPGDRIRLSYGTKRLKKLFAEARIPVARRDRTPVLVDGAGEVLWVPGLARAGPRAPGAMDDLLQIRIG